MAYTYIAGEFGMPGVWYNYDTGEMIRESPAQDALIPQQSMAPIIEQQAAEAKQMDDYWASKIVSYRNAQGQAMPSRPAGDFSLQGVTSWSGADNKDAAIKSWIDNGAYYDPSQPYYDRQYFIPSWEPLKTPLVAPVDLNPNEDEWQALPIVLGLAGAALGGGLLSGAFSGAGAAGAEALAGGATAGMSSGAVMDAAIAQAMIDAGVTSAGLGSAAAAANAGLDGFGLDLIGGAASNAGASTGGLLSDLTNIPTSGLTGGGSSSGGALSGYDPSAGLSGADYGSSLSYDAAEGLGGGLSGGGGSSGGLLSNAGSASSGLFDSLGNLITGDYSKLISGGLSGLGGLLSGNAATSAAETQSDAIIKAAQIAADAAKFKPVGVTTRFGQSQFGYDANGNLVAAGYGLKPDIKAQQDKLMGLSENALTQYQGAQAATAPMGTAAQTMMTLGNNYLGTTPEQQAQKYMQEQLALLSAPRETDMANLQARLAATGRGGLMMGGGASGALAANPELNAYYNSIRQQDLGLAANATQGGMDYAKFGAGMVGSGGDMLKNMYSTQSAAYDPYKTALGGASYLEGLGQNAMDLGINIGAKGTAANAQSGLLMANGLNTAAATMAPANAYSPWGSLLSGAGNAVSQYSNPQQQYKFDPFTGRAL